MRQMMNVLWLCGILLLTAPVVRAQQRAWAQLSIAGNYESFTNTFEKSGYMVTADLEVHGRRKVFGGLLLGFSGYEGMQSTIVEYSTGSIADDLHDKKTQLMFAVGPGFDLLSNHIDRFYLTFYGGYAMVRYEYEYFNDKIKEYPEESPNGFMGLARLGYEHQFAAQITLGLFAQGSYVGKELNWGVGVRLGFRMGEFRLKKPLSALLSSTVKE